MRRKLLFTSIIIIPLVLIFIAFSVSLNTFDKTEYSEDMSYKGGMAPTSDYYEKSEDGDYKEEQFRDEFDNNTSVDVRKVIKTGYISLQSEEFDKVYSDISSKTLSIGGYIQTSRLGKYDVYLERLNNDGNIYNEKDTLKNGYLEVRIPENSFDEFIDYVKNSGELISSNTSTSDITDSYNITDSKLEALEIQESRILDIMKEAKEVSDLIMLENELNRIRTQIQISSNQLSGWDKQISMSTVVIDLREVKSENTNIEVKEKNMWQKSKQGFIKTTNKLIAFIQYSIIFIISALPVLVILGVLGIVLLISVKRKYNKKE